jgi:hypothetical protein
MAVDPAAAARLAALLAAEPGIGRVEATRQRLWKGDEEVETSVQLFVDADDVRLALQRVRDAAQSAGIMSGGNFGLSLGPPWRGVTTAKVYEASA